MTTRGRRIRSVGLHLIAGLAITLVVAVGLPLVAPSGSHGVKVRLHDSHAWQLSLSNDWTLNSIYNCYLYESASLSITYLNRWKDHTTIREMEWLRHGWPFRCLGGGTARGADDRPSRDIYLYRAVSGGNTWMSAERNSTFAFWIPLRPVWTGLILNSFFYAALIATLHPARLKRWNRTRRSRAIIRIALVLTAVALTWQFMHELTAWKLIGSALSAGTIALAIFALIGDRSRGRRRCPKCWYDMGGATTTESGRHQCPECGYVAKNPRKLHKSRRRKSVVLCVFITALLSAACFVSDHAQQNGWWTLVSSRVLIDLIPIGGIDGAVAQELDRRIGRSQRFTMFRQCELTELEQRYLIHRLAHGNILARPVSKRWRQSYGGFLDMNRYSFNVNRLNANSNAQAWTFMYSAPSSWLTAPDEPDLLDAAIDDLYKIPVVVRLQPQAPGAMGAPLFIKATAEHWWPMPTMCRAFARLQGTHDWIDFSDHNGIQMGQQPPGSYTFRFDVRVEQLRQGNPDAEWTTVLEDIITVDCIVK